jgi:short-subunit dehydrogenase
MSDNGYSVTRAGEGGPVRQTDPAIQVSLVSPGVVQTDFGQNARHGGPGSRQMPGAQTAEEVAAIIPDMIESPRPDVSTRPGSRERVTNYYEAVGEDA